MSAAILVSRTMVSTARVNEESHEFYIPHTRLFTNGISHYAFTPSRRA